MANVIGTAGNDPTLTGTQDADTIQGLGGSDTLNGLGGNDTLEGGSGSDILNGGEGNDLIIAGAGDEDVIIGSTGDDTIHGGVIGSIDDPVTTLNILDYRTSATGLTSGIQVNMGTTEYSGTVIKLGGAGTDTYTSITGGIQGTDFADTFTGNSAPATARVAGFGGNDTFDSTLGVMEVDYRREAQFTGFPGGMTISLGGANSLTGTVADTAAGTDTLISVERVIGTNFADDITGNSLNNRLRGENGADILRGLDGNDELRGGGGSDVLEGDDGTDILDGGDGDDLVIGGEGSDTINGGAGADYVFGNEGDDTINGGTGTNDHSSYEIPLGVAGELLADYSDPTGVIKINLDGDTIFEITRVSANSWQVKGIAGTVGESHGTDTVSNIDELDFFIPDVDPDDLDLAFLGIQLGVSVYPGQDPADSDYFVIGGIDDDIVTIDANLIPGLTADDLVEGDFGTGNDTATGHAGENELRGEAGSDVLAGLGGNDFLSGGEGNDNLNGGADDDYIVGDEGNDTIDGGSGTNDTSGYEIPIGQAKPLTVDNSDPNGLIKVKLDGTTIFEITKVSSTTWQVKGLTGTAGEHHGTDLVSNVDKLDFFIPDVDPDEPDLAYVAVPLVNLAPTAQNDSRSVAEGGSVSGSVLSNDSDGDRDSLTVTKIGGVNVGGAGTTLVGAYGSLTIQRNGSFIYAADGNAAEALASGQSATDTFTYVAGDGDLSDDATLAFTITGTNDAAVIGAPSSSFVEEDTWIDPSGNLTATGTISISDVDAGETSFQTTVVSAAGNLGSLVLAANGSYTYTVANGAVQSLSAGQTKAETFTITAADGTTKDVTFTISGVDELITPPPPPPSPPDPNITGTGGNDTLNGTSGNDQMSGGSGADIVAGGAGNDRVSGGVGKDTLTGGTGPESQDQFAFDAPVKKSNADTITDFERAYDQIFLDDAFFKGLGKGTPEGTPLKKSMFAANADGEATSDGTAQIVYDTDDGKLYYDADGVGGRRAVLFALLEDAPNLTFKDFEII